MNDERGKIGGFTPFIIHHLFMRLGKKIRRKTASCAGMQRAE
jgi:hypothetical protein